MEGRRNTLDNLYIGIGGFYASLIVHKLLKWFFSSVFAYKGYMKKKTCHMPTGL